MLATKVDFALLLYDEFDGSAINDANVVFRHKGRLATPLRKREGFYVFRGIGLAEVELEISRPHYKTEKVSILKSRLDKESPVERIRLLREYPGNFPDCDWVSIRCPPDVAALVFTEENELKTGPPVLEEDGAKISLMGYKPGRLLGRRYALNMKDGLTFVVEKLIAPGVYGIDRAPAGKPGSGKMLYRAGLSRSGPDGCCRIPLEQGGRYRVAGAAYWDKEESKWVSVSVPEPP